MRFNGEARAPQRARAPCRPAPRSPRELQAILISEYNTVKSMKVAVTLLVNIISCCNFDSMTVSFSGEAVAAPAARASCMRANVNHV